MKTGKRSVRLSRREVRELLKEVTVYCCGAAGEMSLGRALVLLGKCVSAREEEAPRLRALLEFGSLSRSKGLEEPARLSAHRRVERDVS
jgi:hypothetical protein